MPLSFQYPLQNLLQTKGHKTEERKKNKRSMLKVHSSENMAEILLSDFLDFIMLDNAKFTLRTNFKILKENEVCFSSSVNYLIDL